MSDIVIPREVTLPLSNGRSLTVWAELNHGQYIAMLSRMYTAVSYTHLTLPTNREV